MPESLVNWFSDVGNLSAILGILGVSFAGALAALWRWVFRRKPTELSWAVKTTELLSAERSVFPEEVRVFFKDVQIRGLVKFSYIFWNSGSGVIRRSDISPLSPLRITLEQERGVLKGTLTRSISLDCDVRVVRVAEVPHAVECTFEYLEPDQGFTVEILCTTAKQPVRPSGRIIGAESELFQGCYDESQGYEREGRFYQIFYIVVSSCLLASVIYQWLVSGNKSSSGLVDAFILVFMLIVLFNFLWRMLPRFVRVRHPYAPWRLRD